MCLGSHDHLHPVARDLGEGQALQVGMQPAQAGLVPFVVTLMGGFVQVPQHGFLPEIRPLLAQHGLPPQLNLQLVMELLC